MEGFTQFCIWFLFLSVVIELGWKGWNKYKEFKPQVIFDKPDETNKKELEEEKKNKD